MSYYTKDDLSSSLRDNTNFLALNNSNQGTVIICEFGGRVLGMFPDNETYTLFWINQDLKKTIEHRNRDIGGDRFWLSPERIFFYDDPENWEGWNCPATLDPAYYKIIERNEGGCKVHSKISVSNHLNDERYEGEVTREFKLVKDSLDIDITHIGIEITEICRLNKPNLKINGWNLTNIISGGTKNPGTVLIPTTSLAKPLSYFRTIPNERLFVEKNYIGFKIDVDSIYKLAIRPEDIDFSRLAKIGYILKIPNSEKYGLLLKLSDDIPRTQKECFDEARDHPPSEIGIIQSYNSESPDEKDLRYGEIELQLNMFESERNLSKLNASHTIFAYSGSLKEILLVIKKHLGIDNLNLFE